MIKKFALFGKNVEKSFSPIIYNALAEYYSIDLIYEAISVDSVDEVAEILKSNKFDGANITMPYKVSFIKYLDSIHTSASNAGALNTVIVDDGILTGYNTDSVGFLDAISLKKYKLKSKRVLVYGTGGAARGIVSELVKTDVKGVLVDGNTNESRIAFYKHFKSIPSDKLTMIYRTHGLNVDLLINASPVGSSILPGESINLDRLTTKSVFDIVYEPVNTELLIKAKEKNLQCFYGIEMLVCQAIRAFYLWYPEFNRNEIPVELVRYIYKKISEIVDYNFEGIV